MPYVGQSFGRYRIEEEIGAGGMGVVYRAYDEKLERDLAIKVLTPGALKDEAARKRFRNEARVLSRLNHPCIQTTSTTTKVSITSLANWCPAFLWTRACDQARYRRRKSSISDFSWRKGWPRRTLPASCTAT
jgi:serine/threonine protein kinase